MGNSNSSKDRPCDGQNRNVKRIPEAYLHNCMPHVQAAHNGIRFSSPRPTVPHTGNHGFRREVCRPSTWGGHDNGYRRRVEDQNNYNNFNNHNNFNHMRPGMNNDRPQAHNGHPCTRAESSSNYPDSSSSFSGSDSSFCDSSFCAGEVKYEFVEVANHQPAELDCSGESTHFTSTTIVATTRPPFRSGWIYV